MILAWLTGQERKMQVSYAQHLLSALI